MDKKQNGKKRKRRTVKGVVRVASAEERRRSHLTGIRKDQGGEREKAALSGAQPELRVIWRPSSEFISPN